jgi:hypothetical protein
MLEQAARHARLRVEQERQDVDLRVPEVMALVGPAGESARADAAAFGARRRLEQLEQIPPENLLLARLVAIELDVGALPEAPDPAPVLLLDDGEPLLHGPMEGPHRPGADLVRLRGVRVVVAQVLGERERLARPGRDGDHHGREVLLAAEAGGVRARGFDLVVHAAAEREAGALGAKAQDRSQILRAGPVGCRTLPTKPSPRRGSLVSTGSG